MDQPQSLPKIKDGRHEILRIEEGTDHRVVCQAFSDSVVNYQWLVQHPVKEEGKKPSWDRNQPPIEETNPIDKHCKLLL